VECVLESLDAAGRLEESVEDLSAAAGCSRQAVAEAIELVQALEPAGVAARDLSECLTLQLKRRGVTGLALTVARDHLEDIGRGRYHRIAQDTGASAAQVQAACRLIRSLDPRPGCGFGPPESAGYIVPDLAVLPGEDGLQVVANDEYLPTLRLSGYYRQLLQTTQDAQVREYLSAKVDQAKWVMGHIEQRRTTLLSCARCIVAMQEDFFRRGPGHLAPLTLAQAAERLHIHESTVSRAIRGKYLQCTYGVFPMKYFFCRALPTARGEDVSTQRAKEALREWIDREDKRKPYSDQALSESLRAQGILLSRRTVAKYRDELGIPSAAGRRTL
jgi:RNA polymerase sigma-54 factor